jgi:CHASE3 domain sensor protein
VLLNYHIRRLVLSSLCVGDLVRLLLSGARFAGLKHGNTSTTQNQPHQSSNTQLTENKTTDVVIQQHSRKLLMMNILTL